MGVTDLKIYLINGAAMVMTLTTLEPALKIILLLVSIGYTVSRWVSLYNVKRTNLKQKK